MTWVARFGKRPHSIVKQHELFALAIVARGAGRLCMLCDGATAGVIHCNDCGWTCRLCDRHRPTTAEVDLLRQAHAALCEPVRGSQ